MVVPKFLLSQCHSALLHQPTQLSPYYFLFAVVIQLCSVEHQSHVVPKLAHEFHVDRQELLAHPFMCTCCVHTCDIAQKYCELLQNCQGKLDGGTG